MSIHFIGGAMPESEAARPLTAREVKRQRILRAAIEVFAVKGYFAARMTDMAKQAEVADGTLYLYFEGKEHLLLSSLRRCSRPLHRTARGGDRRSSTTR
jgi:AcrR family transcriptional regulator